MHVRDAYKASKEGWQEREVFGIAAILDAEQAREIVKAYPAKALQTSI